MKPKLILTIILLLIVVGSIGYLIFSGAQNGSARAIDAEQPGNTENPATIKDKLVVYYFHGYKRCSNCITIENNTTEAINTNFSDELAKGIIEYNVINIEEAENKHFIDEYQLYTKSVIVAEFKNGIQTRWKNLKQVWTLIPDKEAFIDYVTAEVNIYLEDM